MRSELSVLYILLRPLLLTIFMAAIIIGAANIREISHDRFKNSIEHYFYYIWFLLPLSVVAFLCGYIAATSRISASGQLITGVLGIASAGLVYLYSSKTHSNFIAGLGTMIVAISVLYGAFFGTEIRDGDRMARLIRLAEDEKRITTYRKNIGLESDGELFKVLHGTEPK